ncbi:hypothetical protein [Maribacter sp. 2307ULW6-5]|uniref:hypothetical protein n=1 Tax=Maribacter sp. 2307ULW6-5 TaxID=3386275 RepID=UPI0039BCE429
MLKSFMFYVVCPLYILCAGLCCPVENDPVFERYEASVPDAVFVDNDQTAYRVGDTLWINLGLPSQLTDVNGLPLDLVELTEATEAFASFGLFLKTEFDNDAQLNLSENEIVEEIGTLSTNEYDSQLGSAALLFDGVYQARHGILLPQAGEFILRFSHLSPDGDAIVYFFS